MPEDAFLTIFDRDGASNGRRFLLDEGRDGVEYRITQSGQAEEHEFTFEGSMGETICRHPRQCPDYYFSQFDTSDGTLRLPPAVTTVTALDIAYTPLTMWEDFDSDGDRAFYIEYRDTTTTPDIVIRKYRVTDDVLVDTELSTTQGGAAQETAPRIGKVASFEGNTFVPAGDESGANHIRKIAVGDISAGTADTYTEGDAGFSNSHAVIDEDGVSKFVICSKQNYRTASTTPETDANFSGNFEVGDSGSPIIWTVESGGFVYFAKPDNLYEGDPTSARPLLDIEANRKNKPFQTYDDFDGHMSANVGTAILYPHRTGFHRYRRGASLNLSIDNIPGYREVFNITDIPIGLRHYATDAVGQWVYAIYKPPGFANSANCNIMSAFYRPGAARELTWRTLITRTEDLIGLKIDSDKRLWFVQNPNDPAIAAGTVTFDAASNANGTGTSLAWSHTVGTGSQRILVIGLSHLPSSAENITSVYFEGQLCNLIGSVGGTTGTAQLWYLTNPPSGSGTITASFSGSDTGIVGGASSWSGVDQGSPIRSGSLTSATGTSTAPSVTVSSATNDFVLDCLFAANAETATDDGGNSTQRWNTASGSNTRGAGSSETGAASVVASWTLDNSQVWTLIAASIQPGVLGNAAADLNYMQLNRDGSPRTALGIDRGAVSSTYEHYTGEIWFDRRVQARYMRVETENLDSTTSLQMKIHRDGGTVDSIGSAITSDDFHQIDFTVGTTDLLRRGRMRLTLDTNGSYAPTVSDPRIIRAFLGIRSPDTYKAVMRTGHSIDSARTERKILRQRKGAGTVTITESWAGTQFRADVVGIRDLETRKDENGQLMYRTEIEFRRFDVES